MPRTDWAGLPDGAPIIELPSGLVIVRYHKHDPARTTPARNRPRRFRMGGDDVSTFLPTWPVERVVRFIERHVADHHWTMDPGNNRHEDILLDEAVGLVGGSQVRTIRVSSDGHYLHAYPIKDR